MQFTKLSIISGPRLQLGGGNQAAGERVPRGLDPVILVTPVACACPAAATPSAAAPALHSATATGKLAAWMSPIPSFGASQITPNELHNNLIALFAGGGLPTNSSAANRLTQL